MIQTLAQTLTFAGASRDASDILAHCEIVFSGSPLSTLFEYHRLIEDHKFLQASHAAKRLSDRFPQRSEFSFFLGYALWRSGEYRQAVGPLSMALHTFGDHDADTLKILGFCHVELGEPDTAREYLSRARQACQELGLPTTDIEGYEGRLGARGERNNHPSMWLLKLSAHRHADLTSCRREDIRQVVANVGSKARSGDYCFFAADSYAREGQGDEYWRIVAIYQLKTDPVWHPQQGRQSVLELVERPQVGIPLPIRFDDAGNRHDSIFQLDLGALDTITEAVRRYSAGEAELDEVLAVRSA